jgi:hypothetical protein
MARKGWEPLQPTEKPIGPPPSPPPPSEINLLEDSDKMRNSIIKYFKSGKAMEDDWRSMAAAVWYTYHGRYHVFVKNIFERINKDQTDETR